MARARRLCSTGQVLRRAETLRQSMDMLQACLRIYEDLLGRDCDTGQAREVVVKHLLETGAGLDAKSWNNRTLLWLAAYGGHVAMVRELLDRGAGLETKDAYVCVPLQMAAANGHKAIVQELLDRGAAVDGGTCERTRASGTFASITSLHWALGNGHDGVDRLLRARGARESSDTTKSHLQGEV